MEIWEAHFPSRAPIDAYGNGGFRFANMSHRGSILCLPSGIHGWQPQTQSVLIINDIAKIIDEADQIEILLVGTGIDPQPLQQDIRTLFRKYRISVDCMNTGAAVRTYNVLLAEERAVAAALIAVE